MWVCMRQVLTRGCATFPTQFVDAGCWTRPTVSTLTTLSKPVMSSGKGGGAGFLRRGWISIKSCSCVVGSVTEFVADISARGKSFCCDIQTRFQRRLGSVLAHWTAPDTMFPIWIDCFFWILTYVDRYLRMIDAHIKRVLCAWEWNTRNWQSVNSQVTVEHWYVYI